MESTRWRAREPPTRAMNNTLCNRRAYRPAECRSGYVNAYPARIMCWPAIGALSHNRVEKEHCDKRSNWMLGIVEPQRTAPVQAFQCGLFFCLGLNPATTKGAGAQVREYALVDKTPLTIQTLCVEAAAFADVESSYNEPRLYGVTDGKAVGTYLEKNLLLSCNHNIRSARVMRLEASTSRALNWISRSQVIRQPQSSCPFRSARQKIYGLGYHLIIFVYEKSDNHEARTGRLNIAHTIFVEKSRTADYQMTRGLRQIIDHDGNENDIVAFLQDRNLPVDDIEAQKLAEDILREPPLQAT